MTTDKVTTTKIARATVKIPVVGDANRTAPVGATITRITTAIRNPICPNVSSLLMVGSKDFARNLADLKIFIKVPNANIKVNPRNTTPIGIVNGLLCIRRTVKEKNPSVIIKSESKAVKGSLSKK